MRKVIIINIFVIISVLLAACSRQGSNSKQVKITLNEYGIVSSQANFEVGAPYHFVVTNQGQAKHEIMIMPPLEEMGMHMDMEELDEMALAMIEEDELPPGATVAMDYTFTEPAPAGSLEFACHTPGHYEQGMRLPIIVK